VDFIGKFVWMVR